MPDTFTKAYIECALWADSPEDDPYEETELAPVTLSHIERDCAAFQAKAGGLIDDDRQAGHDFWLTRQGHGAGFWDGDWSEPAATTLSDLAHSFGPFELYRGDDGVVYACGHELPPCPGAEACKVAP